MPQSDIGKGNHQNEKKENIEQLIKRSFHGKHASIKKFYGRKTNPF